MNGSEYIIARNVIQTDQEMARARERKRRERRRKDAKIEASWMEWWKAHPVLDVLAQLAGICIILLGAYALTPKSHTVKQISARVELPEQKPYTLY